MPHVLGVSTREFGNPIPCVILVEPRDGRVHKHICLYSDQFVETGCTVLCSSDDYTSEREPMCRCCLTHCREPRPALRHMPPRSADSRMKPSRFARRLAEDAFASPTSRMFGGAARVGIASLAPHSGRQFRRFVVP